MPNNVGTGMTNGEYRTMEELLQEKIKGIPRSVIPRLDLDDILYSTERCYVNSYYFLANTPCSQRLLIIDRAPYNHQLDKLLIHRGRLNVETNCWAERGRYDEDHAATLWHFGLDPEHSWDSGDSVTKARVFLTLLEHVSGTLRRIDRMYLDAWLEYTKRSKDQATRTAFISFWNSQQAGRDVLSFTQQQIDRITGRLDQLKSEFTNLNHIYQSHLASGTYSQEAYNLVQGLLFEFLIDGPVRVKYREMVPLEDNTYWAALNSAFQLPQPGSDAHPPPSLEEITRVDSLISRLMTTNAPHTTVHTLIVNMERFLHDNRAGANMPAA